MEQLEQKAVELIDQLQSLAQPAAQLAIDAVHYGAIIDLICATLALPLIYGGVKLAAWFFKKANDTDSESGEIASGIAGVITGVVTGIISISAAFVILGTNTWLAIFAPELALARKVIESLSDQS